MRRLSLCLLLLASCSSSAPTDTTPAAPTSETPAGSPPPAKPDSPASPNPGTPAPTPGIADPTTKGPNAIAELDATTKVASTGDNVPVHVAYPTKPGSYPVVIVAHGFQLPALQYYGYVRHLASFGYVALTADYPASFTSVSNVRDAKNLSGALDWALASKEVGSLVDATKAGVMGHSRGGKAAVLAASSDTRFQAVFTLDPVDVKPPLGCDAKTECPDSRDALATRSIPSAFIGETLDASASGFGQACAPAEGNYKTYRAKAASPSIEVTVVGAGHMSFLDDPSTCGFTCSACKQGTASSTTVLGLARAQMVAFFERHLRGDAAYQTYLDGDQAKALWVTPGLATIVTK